MDALVSAGGKDVQYGRLARTDRPVPLSLSIEQDKKRGILTDEEAIFHLACHFVMDTSYTPARRARRVGQRHHKCSLVPRARSRTPAEGTGQRWGQRREERRSESAPARRGDHVRRQDRAYRSSSVSTGRASGFARNGYPIELGRQRAYSGCHWCAIPGTGVHGERLCEGEPRRSL